MLISVQEFLAQVAGSEIFAGGLALGALGVALGGLHLVWQALRAHAARRWMASITVDSRSAAFRHLCLWLDGTGAPARVRHQRATGLYSKGCEVFAPVPGTHLLRLRGRFVWYTRVLEAKASRSQGLETLTLTVLFARPELLSSWVAEGAAIAAAQERVGPALHVLKGEWWDHVCDLPERSLKTVLADDDRIDQLAEDMRHFFGAEDWYRQRGVPWRRGYLLYGPPGTGKSSVIRALASDLGRDIATVTLASPKLDDEDLRGGLSSSPKGALIVLEDIDAAFREREADAAVSGITFSGLLNAIDGVAAQEGRVLVMTTNHRDRLDAALIRPGRADVQVELGMVGAETAARMFLRFFPGEEALAARFQVALGDTRLTPAALQGWLLHHAEDASAAADASGLRDAHPTLAAE